MDQGKVEQMFEQNTGNGTAVFGVLWLEANESVDQLIETLHEQQLLPYDFEASDYKHLLTGIVYHTLLAAAKHNSNIVTLTDREKLQIVTKLQDLQQRIVEGKVDREALRDIRQALNQV